MAAGTGPGSEVREVIRIRGRAVDILAMYWTRLVTQHTVVVSYSVHCQAFKAKVQIVTEKLCRITLFSSYLNGAIATSLH